MKILDIDNINWDMYVENLPNKMQDVYYTQNYYRMCEYSEKGDAKLAVYEDKDGIIIYPFVIRELKDYNLNDVYYDIETGYGYGGPTGNINNEDLCRKFENEFTEYCKEQNIICEFIRFHPLLKNENVRTKIIFTIQI